MTRCRCPRLSKDLRPAPWYGDRLLYDVAAVLFMALLLVGMVLA